MQIKSTITNSAGVIMNALFESVEDLSQLDGKSVHGVHGFCFCGGKLVLVYSDKKGRWSLPGGGVEEGESFEEALIREIKEETNMRILHQKLIGFQEVFEPSKIVRQTRSFCIVEPYGPFLGDPDNGEITKIKLIDPKEFKKYVNWGVIGDWIMERSLSLLKNIK